MACIEHFCSNCGETWFDNNPNGDCQKCGREATHIFDEQFDEHDEYEDE